MGYESLVVEQDNTDNFQTGFPDSKNTIERDGIIDIDSKDGGKYFEILLTDKRLDKVPWRGPAKINLHGEKLFDIIQECRAGWERALEATKTRRSDSAGWLKEERPYEERWCAPIGEQAFSELAAKLAVAGDQLFQLIFERDPEGDRGLDEVAAYLRKRMGAGECVWNVYSSDFHIPWRMIYTHPPDAGKLDKSGRNFVPSGFWGYQHIIGQYTRPLPPKNDVVVKSGKVNFGAALDDRIDDEFNVACVRRHLQYVNNNDHQVIPDKWTKIDDLTEALAAESFKQQVLYFLCHAEVAGTADKPVLAKSFLQLTDGKLDAVGIRLHVRNRFQPNPPLIFINACRGGQLGTLVRHSFTFATEFLEQGALCVIGPQIEIPAVFAGEFGAQFFERFIARPATRPPTSAIVRAEMDALVARLYTLLRSEAKLPAQKAASPDDGAQVNKVRRDLRDWWIARTKPRSHAGLILRDLTREMWKHRNPFGLVYSLYASADCHVRWEEEGRS